MKSKIATLAFISVLALGACGSPLGAEPMGEVADDLTYVSETGSRICPGNIGPADFVDACNSQLDLDRAPFCETDFDLSPTCLNRMPSPMTHYWCQLTVDNPMRAH